MEFVGSGIMERPVHLLIRLGKTPGPVAYGLRTDRLTRKRSCKGELNGRVLVSSVVENVEAKPKRARTRFDDTDHKSAMDQSGSSESRDPPIPVLISALSGAGEERAPPIPTPPVYEAVTRGDHPAVSSWAATTADGLKQQALQLIRRTPSRRGSLAEATTSHAITDPLGVTSHPPATNMPVPTSTHGMVRSNVGVASVSAVNQPTTGNDVGPSLETTGLGSVHRNDTSWLGIPQV